MKESYPTNMTTKTEGIKRNIIENLNILERKAEKRGYLKGYEDGFKDGQNAPTEEDHKEVKVGDEVIDPNGIKAVVTNMDTHIHLVYRHNGKTWKAPKSIPLRKTGKRFRLN